MDYIRSVVSGKKKRFVEGEFNLDLTYVCPRLVAMAYPAQGIESLYRNPIEQVISNIFKVSKMIKKKHLDNYYVINLSSRKYEYAPFDGKVFEVDWDDHHAPQIHLLFETCKFMYDFYSKDEKNTIFVHCLAGKGRTGTIICCFLLFIGEFKLVDDVLQFYEKQRFDCAGLGVNQPCQKRYIQYFHTVLIGTKVYPSIKQIQNIVMQPPVDLNNGKSYQMDLEIVQNDDTVIYRTPVYKVPIDVPHFKIDIPAKDIFGDVKIQFWLNGTLKKSEFMRVSFNTAFKDNSFNKDTIDPSQVADDVRFTKLNLYIEIVDRCKECGSSVPLLYKCEYCRAVLGPEYYKWKRIYEIMATERQNVFIHDNIQQLMQK